MSKVIKNIFFSICVVFFVGTSLKAQTQKKDTTSVKQDSISLPYKFTKNQSGGLFLDTLAEKEIIFDRDLNQYVILEKIGDYYTKTPVFLTRKEYEQYRLKRDMLLYFKEKVGATNSKRKGAENVQKNLLPSYYVNSKFFETIFGGNEISFTPTGNLNLKLGFIYQNTENPQITQENRSSLVFDFGQQINASLRAKVGERLQFTANYDTQATFDFQNLVNIDYTPTEDDILQGIEAGNVSMPIKNSLINGAQSLFGVKTALKFGNTNVTAIYSQQNSESNTVVSEGGASVQTFELRTTDYDNDRHFFLSQYFVDNYAKSLERYPLISSQINITRIEVWITNRNASTEDFRSIVALADLGETEEQYLVNPNAINSTNPPSLSSGNLPTNDSNNLGDLLTETSGIRNISSLRQTLPVTFQEGTDYSILENARKLNENEYTLNSQLGFISLSRRLQDGEVLAVAYEYTVAGNVSGSTEKSFRVGEFSNDGILAPNNLAVKLLRSEILQTKRKNTTTDEVEAFPTWRLMMKNIYALGAFPLSQDGFRFEIQYRDDQTGIPSNVLQRAVSGDVANTPLLQVLNLDQLDQTQFRDPDGFFDYVEGITVNSQNGYIIFPTPEPFGKNLAEELDADGDAEFLFEELYLNVKVNAKVNFQNKDKYILTGYFKSNDTGGISLGAFNVPRGSVTVTAGGRQLAEGIDYVVDYNLGQVQIIDPSLKASGTPISVSTENNTFFNQQRKRFMGIDIEHTFSENFILGATVLNVNERPLTPKVNYGADPINNTMLGMNLDFSTEAPILTKLANKLPFVDTDAPSNVSVRADFAYLLPGTPNGINVAGAATTYLDDFEASQIPISILSPLDWYEASTPKTTTFPDFNGDLSDAFEYNYKRAKLAWYTIDQIFYGFGDTPSGISADDLSRAETTQINFNDLFPNQQFDVTQNTQIRTLDLAYFPSERGSYNYDTSNVNSDGTFTDPENRWAGIMRPLNTNNFDQANVEYIQFWMMDPYQNYSITNEEGLPQNIDPNNPANQVGDLYINLGNISEDILKDGRKMYENGLPTDGTKLDEVSVNETNLAFVPRNTSILYAFNEEDAARTNQDLGFDGSTDVEEANRFTQVTGLPLPDYLQSDPASDNFRFFRGGDFETNNASIITRYKDFNNTQGNSPTLNQSTENFPTSSTTYPDVEDINRDQTMNGIESFWEYKISMNRNDLTVGKNFIVDERNISLDLNNGEEITTKWYQFRVPIRSGVAQNGITDFNSIRFIRMFLTKFKMPVVLRFAELDLVRGDWRRYTRTLPLDSSMPEDLGEIGQLEKFEVGVVNIEQNPNIYATPPGVDRESLQGSTTVQLQNEQSVTLRVNELPANEIRAIYKNLSSDLRRFKNLEMFIHMQENEGAPSISNNDFSAVIRIGTDLDENFYQIEIPLVVSEDGIGPLQVWPEANNMDVVLSELGKIKLERDAADFDLTSLYPAPVVNEQPAFRIRVQGNPTLAQIRTLMLGLKNNTSSPKSGEVWFNELRASDFDNKGGWAAVINADANLADVANVSLAGSIQTVGFGNVEDRVVQRNLDETKQYDFATTVNLGKVFTPKNWGIQLPMSYSKGETFIDPLYDPQYQDVLLDDALEQNDFSQFSRDYTKRTSISFINVRKNRNPNTSRKPKFYDVENIGLSYSHNREFRRNYNIEKSINENVNASASYSYNFKSKSVEPFKNSNFFKSNYLKLIKDFNFNLIPSTVAVNSRINRNFNEQRSRNLVPNLSAQPTLTQRRFLFDWDYTLAFDLTKSIQLNFNATNSNIYDAFGSDEELAVFDNFFNTGRPNQYNQKLNATYKLPIDKIPFLKFIKADYAYTADFEWRAQSQDPEVIQQVGNLIQNANTHNLNTNFNLERLYRGFGFNKWYNSTSKERKAKRKKSKKKDKNSNIGLPKTPTVVRKKKNIPITKKIVKGVYDIATSVKQAKISYAENNGQMLSGFEENVGFFGGPSTGFAFGSQVDIRNKALENGWLVTPRLEVDDPNTIDIDESTYYNKTYNRTFYSKLDYSFTAKPFKDLNIEIRGNRIQTRDISQQIDIVEDGSINGSFIEIAPFETGNFSTSYFMANTMFKNGDELFRDLRDFRSIISQNLANQKLSPGAENRFGENSQQVLLPAFLAAYSGKDPNKVKSGLFRDIPLPNWTLRYNGLMKLKWFKSNFSSFVVSHGYISSYTVSGYTNNLLFDASNPFPADASGSFEPELLASAVTLVDEFSPLVRLDMKMKNSFSFRGEINRDRALNLNFNNNTLTDVSGTEYIFGMGYVFKDVKVSTRFTGKKQTLKGDVNLRADVSLRDNITQIRAIEDDNNQISGGQRLFSIKFTADYALSRSLTASFYYNHQATRYAISTTFPRQAINGGINIIYNLGGN